MDVLRHFSTVWTTCTLLFFSCLGDVSAGTSLAVDVYRELNPEVPSDWQPVLKGPTLEGADSLEAERFFVRGRTLEKKEKFSEAIRCYERAWRYAPHDTILSHIVSLTSRQDRIGEMSRYFPKLEHPEKLDVLVLRNIGLQLTMGDEFSQAVRAYEAAMKSLTPGMYPAIQIALRHEVGRLYYLIERYDEAISCFTMVERAIEDPKRFDLDDDVCAALMNERVLTLYLLVDSYLLKGDGDKAIEVLDKVVRLEKQQLAQSDAEKKTDNGDANSDDDRDVAAVPETLEEIDQKADFVRARIASLQKDYVRAEKLLKHLFTVKFHDEGDALCLLYENVLSAQNRSSERIAVFEQCYATDSTWDVLGYFLAGLYLKEARETSDPAIQAEMWGKAEKLLETWTDETPTVEGYLGLMEIAVRQGDSEKLLHVLYKILSQQETEKVAVLLLTQLAETLYPEAESKDAAETKTTPLSDTDPRSPELVDSPFQKFFHETVAFSENHYSATNRKIPWQLFWAIGFLAKEAGQAEISDRFYQAAQNVLVRMPLDENNAPGVSFFLERGGDLMTQERLDDALAVMRLGQKSVLSNSDAVATLRYNITNVLILKKDFPAALKEISQAVQADEESWILREHWAWTLFQTGQWDKAAQVYTEILEKNQANPESVALSEMFRDLRCSFSALEVLRGHTAEAEELLEQVLDEFPDDIGAKNDLAYLWATQKKHLHRALPMAQSALAGEPENYAYLDTLGWIHFQRGELDEALRYLTQAVEKGNDAVAFSHLADVYLAQKNEVRAKEYFTRSLETFRANEQERSLFDQRERQHAEEQLKRL